MRNIIVVEVSSTGVNFIPDILSRNYNPVALQLKIGQTEENKLYAEMVAGRLESIDEDFDVIYEKDTYEETLEMVRQYDPLLVVAGSEKGVILATKLANDLNLKCNPIENLDALTLKHKMQEKIAEKGLRHIRGKAVKSVEEAIDYFDEENLSEVVVKPTYSAGSVGVKICSGKQEMIDAINELSDAQNLYGDDLCEFVVQERIRGEEYIVNTVSCDGVHRVTLIWKYHKVETPEGRYIYDYMETVNELSLGEANMVEYAYAVADALGVKYGPIHGEFMVDEDGPVLIEVNCRPCGGDMEIEYLDSLSGQHETDSIIDSYLNPQNFNYQRSRGYRLYNHGAVKFFIVPKDIIAVSSPMNYISNNLKSHYKTTPGFINDAMTFVKTQDFETIGGSVFLTHPDGYAVQKDIDFLRSVEKYAFQLILSDGSVKKTVLEENTSNDDIKKILGMVKAFGSILFVTDEKFDDVELLQISPEDIEDVSRSFDCVVVNLNKSILNKRDDYVSRLFLKIINRVKFGGLIIIPESTYQYTAHGRVGAEALVRVLDLRLELPLHGLERFVIASKTR